MTRRDMVWLHSAEGVPGWHYYPVWLDAEDREGTGLRAFSLIADGLPMIATPRWAASRQSLHRENELQTLAA